MSREFRRFVDDVRIACERYLASEGAAPIPIGDLVGSRSVQSNGPKPAKKSTSVKGNPICKCGHNYSVHDEPRDVCGIPQNICRGCAAEDGALGCPEFVSKRGAVVTTSRPGMPPKTLNGEGDSRTDANGFTACHRAILAALFTNSHQAWTAQQISILAVYTQSGTFNMALADLREMELIEGSPASQLTAEGRKLAASAEVKAAVHNYSANGLRTAWSHKLGQEAVVRMLNALAKYGAMSVTQLAERCNYTQSGTFNQTLAKLRRMGLIKKGQPVRLGDELS